MINRSNFAINLLTLLMLVFASAITYGIMEAKYIPTDTMKVATIPWTGGHVAYYHLCLLSLMAVASFSLTILHVREIAEHRKKYKVLMGVASMPLALLVEDITWFITRWQPIRQTEWTVWPAGWALPLGFTWVPVWYTGTILLSTSLLILARHYAIKGSKNFLTRNGRV